MFEVTGLEIVVLVGVASFLLGKREVPQLARIVGRGTGKMVALLNTARDQFTKATQDTQFSRLTHEVQQNMYELDSIRCEVRAAGSQKQPFRLRRPGMPATGSPPAGSLDPKLSKTHGDIISASVSSAIYSMPGEALPQRVRDISNISSRSSNKKLGELAMAELLWQESALAGGKGGKMTHPNQQQLQQQASAPFPPTGSTMMENVILETLLRDHVDRVSFRKQGEKRTE
ncbi:hypothetical protein VYU27_004860 [Nannochloropsis oceanica]